MFPEASKPVIESLLIVDETIINYDLIEDLVDHIHEEAEWYIENSREDYGESANNNDGSAKSGKRPRQKSNGSNGAILIFLPGLMEITTLYDRLRLKDESAFKVYPLHSSLSTQEQKAVFEKPPPGVRKVVIATNIA